MMNDSVVFVFRLMGYANMEYDIRHI